MTVQLHAQTARRDPTVPRANDDVLLLGLNKGVDTEARELRARGANVTVIRDAFENGRPRGDRAGAPLPNLATPEATATFARSLGLSPEQTTEVGRILDGADPQARDELGQLARVWAKGERGGTVPSRLVLSGHSTGSRIWGDDNGGIRFDELGALAKVMPRAAAQVQDLHLAACYAGGETNVDRFRDAFPNLKTAWGYTGSAPGAESGATAHLRRWERATRGDATTLSRDVAAGTRKGENVATWTATRGYEDGRDRTSLNALRGEVDGREYTFNQHFAGLRDVTNSQTGPLRDYYNQLQRVIQHPELGATERTALEAKRDQTIRLLYYPTHVAPRFADANRDAITAGYRSLGLDAPAFGTMRRQDALRAIGDLERRVGELGDAAPEAARTLAPLLTRGLRDLDRSLIPEGWL